MTSFILMVNASVNNIDNFRALRLIASAAKAGHLKAREMIATASALAWGGLPLSINKAVEDFRKLADEGNPRGQLGLGIMHAAGVGVNVSVPHAIVYLTFASLGGDELAEMALVSVSDVTDSTKSL